MNRRSVLIGAAGIAGLTAIGTWQALRRQRAQRMAATRQADSGKQSGPTAMRYRKFGTTGLDVSEVGFGSWGIGG
jgi:hypothetical protein